MKDNCSNNLLLCSNDFQFCVNDLLIICIDGINSFKCTANSSEHILSF